MSNKYFETKEGSLERKITQIATEQSSIKKYEPKIKLESKTYFDRKQGSLTDVAAKVVSEGTDYQAKFKAELEKTGKSINQMSDAEKKAFFDKIDREYKAKNEQLKEFDMFARDKRAIAKGTYRSREDAEREAKRTGGTVYKSSAPNSPTSSWSIYFPNKQQRALLKKQNEQASAKEVDKFHTSLDKLVHKSFGKSSKEKNETHTFMTDKMNKKQKDAKGEDEVINPIKEGKMKDIATDQSELKRLNARLSQLKDKKASDQGDTTNIEKEILQTQRSIKDVQIRLKNVPKEVKNEAVKEPYAVGMAAAMKQTGDKPPLKKSTITKAHDIAKSIEKDQKNEQDEVPAGYHKMPDGKIMKDSEHKKDESKKSYYEMRKDIKAQVEKGQRTMTGKKPASIDTSPRTEHI